MNKFVSGLAALSALALVAGCATDDMVTGASVTRFHLGQPIARGPIAVESVDPRDTGSLEFAQVSASIARELTRLGWPGPAQRWKTHRDPSWHGTTNSS